MKKLKFLFILLIPLIMTLNISNNTSAYTFFNNFNITSISYYVNSVSGNPTVQNSINSYATTPIITETITNNYLAILRPTFTLNKNATLSKTKRFLMQFELTTKTSFAGGDIYLNTYFSCPRGSGNFRVSECRISDSDKNVIGERIEKDDPAAGEDLSFAIQTDKNYLVELEIYYNSDEDTTVSSIELLGRFLSVSKSTNASPLPISLQWQISYNTTSSFYYTDPNATADAINEQNRKDDQDRSNINDQQEENDSEASDQEEEASQTGQTLIGAFTSLVNALGNVHQTNCKLPNMSVYSIQLKNMDMCSVNMPSGVSALAGIAISLLIVKMGISLVKRMIALYKEIIG